MGLTAHALWSHAWTQAVILSFATGCYSLWAKFSGRFMQILEQEAEQRGETLAQQLIRTADRLALGLTSQFQSKYYKRLVYVCRDFQTQGLDKDRILKLHKVFVPLRIVSKDAVQVSPHLIQFHESAADETGQREIGDFLAAMQTDPASRRIAILGAPGSGKTTLLRYLTLSYATNDYRRLHPNAPKLIPVLLYLRDVYLEIVKDQPPTLAELITTQVTRLQPSDPLQPPPGWFADKLRQNQCLVMLDGLDEVANEPQRQQVSHWVDQQMQDYPDTAFILTSRPFGYQNAQLEQAVTVLEVRPFTLEQMQQFIHNWYLETEVISRAGQEDLGVREEAGQQAEDLIDRVRNSPPLAAMALNPLLLTMIAVVHRRGSALPGKRVDLYKEICQVLLEKRQQAKRIPDPLSAAQKQTVLQRLALWLMDCQTRKFTATDASLLLANQLELVSRTQADPEEFLKQIKQVSGLLITREQEGVYEFAHLSFQEYLAAVQIKETNQEALLIQAFQQPEQLSWWAETIRLYAAQGDASALIGAALQNQSVKTLTLAYDCLKEGKSVDPTARQQLEEILEAGLEAPTTELFDLAAQVKLSRRLSHLLRIDDDIEIDTSYITCAEYQLFIDHNRANGKNIKPDRWTTERFPLGNAQRPIAGVRASDAEAFCQWLTQQPDAVRFQYRLPTLAEAQAYAITENQVGCWAMDGDSRVIAGIESEQWQVWREELVRLFARDRDLALDLDLNLDLDLALDLALDLDLARARDLARALDLARARARALADYGLIRFYLLLTSAVWALLADVYDRASKNRKIWQSNRLSRKRCEELSRESASKRDEVLNLYAFLVLLEERREGRMPAWEGIRIVRERAND